MPAALPQLFLLLSLLASFGWSCIPTETPDYIYDQEWLQEQEMLKSTTSVLLSTVRETTPSAPTSPSSAAPTTTTTTSATTTPTTTSASTSTTTSTTTTTTTPHNCPSNPSMWKYNAVNGHCYYANTGIVAWQAAEDNCQGYDGNAHLASISDQQENDFIFNMVTTTGTTYWIGLQQLGNTNTFSSTGLWNDNSMVKYDVMEKIFLQYDYMGGYSNWVTLPMMNVNNRCAYFTGPTGGANEGKWSDANCAATASYICEVPAT